MTCKVSEKLREKQFFAKLEAIEQRTSDEVGCAIGLPSEIDSKLVPTQLFAKLETIEQWLFPVDKLFPLLTTAGKDIDVDIALDALHSSSMVELPESPFVG